MHDHAIACVCTTRDVMDNKEVVDHLGAEVLKWRRMKEDEENERKDDDDGKSEEGQDPNGLRQTAEQFLHEVCRGLCKRAKRRGSRDDITVLVVIFGPVNPSGRE